MNEPLAYRFGNWRLLPGQRLLELGGQPVKLGGRAFDMLLALVEQRHRVLSKHELMDLVWPQLVVEENNLQVQMVALRKLLGHPAIATVPGRGYRFTMVVDTSSAAREAEAPAQSAAAAAVFTARTNLPSSLPELIGRQHDLAALRKLVDEHTLVTVAGAGGIGKTRLAQAAASASRADFSAGVWWVELAVLSEPAGVAAAVAQALQVRHDGERDATQATLAALGREPALLVLDNAEHLIDGAVSFVQAVLSQAPNVRILVTSQEVLRLPTEHVLRLSTLALPGDDSLAAASDSGAVALFVARAKAVDPRFELKADNHGAIADICRRLDGIPLAIELAAARLPLLGLQALRTRLDERFRLLTAGSRAVLRRHQTLRAALEWSHALLTPAEQVVFRRLGVFVGGFTLALAQRVADDEHIDPWDVLEHLGALVDKSLVLAEGDDMPRYRLLETTRLYALECLDRAGEMPQLLLRHAQTLQALLTPPATDVWSRVAFAMKTAALAAELDNMRAVLQWLPQCEDDTLALDLAVRAGTAFFSAGLYAEFLARAKPLAPRIHPAVPPLVQALYWHRVAGAGLEHAEPGCDDAALNAAALFRGLGDGAYLFECLTSAISIRALRGRAHGLEPLIDEARALLQPDWPGYLHARFDSAMRRWHMALGRHEQALACALQEAEHDKGRADGGEHLAMGCNVATCELALGLIEPGLARAEAALAALVACGARADHQGMVTAAVAQALGLLGRHAAALALHQQALRQLRPMGQDLMLLEPLAGCLVGLGRLADAASVLGHVDAYRARRGDQLWPCQRRWRQPLETALTRGLTPEAHARALARGAAIGRDTLLALALG